MGISNALNNRPIRVLGFITALHSIIYGIGYLFGIGGFNGALVGLSIDNVVLTSILGAVLTAVGVILVYAYTKLHFKWINYISKAQGAIWLFISLMYLFNGAYLLAFGIGLTWAIISVYISFATQNRINILAYDRTLKAREDTVNENQF